MDLIAYAAAAAALLGTRYIYPGRVGYALLCVALMVAVPALCMRLRGRRLSDYLIGAGDLRLGLMISLAMLIVASPIMYYGSTLPEFQAYYPDWPGATESLGNFILFETYILVIMVCTEFYFRGFLMNQLLTDTRRGNVVHAIIYMLAHIGKPPLEVVYSLPVGWIFGKVDLRCRSILPSLTMHFVSSVIFDLMILYQRGIRLI
jgi:uncharacterized protein